MQRGAETVRLGEMMIWGCGPAEGDVESVNVSSRVGSPSRQGKLRHMYSMAGAAPTPHMGRDGPNSPGAWQSHLSGGFLSRRTARGGPFRACGLARLFNALGIRLVGEHVARELAARSAPRTG